MIRKLNRTRVAISLMLCLMAGLVWQMISSFRVFDREISDSVGAQLLFFDLTLAEYISVIVVLCLLLNTKRPRRFLGYFFFLLVFTVYLVQFASLYFGGELLGRLVLENIHHADFVGGVWTPFLPLLFVLFWTFIALFLNKMQAGREFSKATPYVLGGAMIVACGFATLEKILPAPVVASRNGIFDRVGIPHTSPLLGFIHLWTSDQNQSGFLSQDEIREVRRYGFPLEPTQKYPFIQSQAYKTPSPLAKLNLPEPVRPNVILIFIEGMSARAITESENRYPGLAPNLLRFSKKTLTVDNYWNHTAASYRGMKGQLCSLFPVFDGVGVLHHSKNISSIRYHCLPDLFHEKGYSSTFLNAHTKDHSFLDEMMPLLGFQTTENAENISKKYLSGAPSAFPQSLSDHQFFAGIIGHLKEREKDTKKSDPQKPFFIATYNLGTHAFLDIGPGELKYGDGKNNALNTIHNFDHAFGEFLDYFESSGLAKNTVLFVTSDHCHYTEPTFVSAFDAKNYPRLFIDQIPLMIYIPGADHGVRYDAINATSIDLAPTMAHVLQLPNGPTPWMGRSIFEKDQKIYSDIGVAWFLSSYFVIKNGIPEYAGDPNHVDPRKRAIRRYFDFTTKIELADRVWDPLLRKQKPLNH